MLTLRNSKIAGVVSDFYEYTPADFTEKKFPIVIFCIGQGEVKPAPVESVLKNPLPKLWRDSPEGHDYIGIVPQWGQRYFPTENMLQVIDYAKRTFAVNWDGRVFLTGISLGGSIVSAYLNEYGPDGIDAVVLCSPLFNIGTRDQLTAIANSSIEMKFFHNEFDPQVSPWQSKNAVAALIGAGMGKSKIERIEYKGVNSHDAWTKGFSPEIVKWMLSIGKVVTETPVAVTPPAQQPRTAVSVSILYSDGEMENIKR